MPGERAAEVHPKAVEQTAVAYGRSLTNPYFVSMYDKRVNVDCVCLCRGDWHPMKFCAKKKKDPCLALNAFFCYNSNSLPHQRPKAAQKGSSIPTIITQAHRYRGNHVEVSTI